MGNNTLGILGLSCLGGITAMVVLINGTSVFQMVQLFTVILACSGFNGLVICQLKPSFIFKYLTVSVIVCSIIIIVNMYSII